MSDFMYKVILVGDTSVGKSSVMKRFADDSFSETYLATIGVDFKFK
jgi:Ras-related protein Rab-1A